MGHMGHTEHATSDDLMKKTPMQNEYQLGFTDGMTVAVTLARAGASPDDIGLLLERDPGKTDPREYSDQLGQLRAILDTSGLFGVTP